MKETDRNFFGGPIADGSYWYNPDTDREYRYLDGQWSCEAYKNNRFVGYRPRKTDPRPKRPAPTVEELTEDVKRLSTKLATREGDVFEAKARAERTRALADVDIRIARQETKEAKKEIATLQKASTPLTLNQEIFKLAETLPPIVSDQMLRVVKGVGLTAGVKAMVEREKQFESRLAAILSGILVYPESRQVFDRGLDAAWTIPPRTIPEIVDEVVVGAGLHAAIYCSVRAKMGAPPPLVLEGTNKVGGAFAISERPSFYMNSRNRPGLPSVPGDGGSLNYLPGFPVQPHDIGSAEYLTNTDLSGPIRLALAMSGSDVWTGKRVTGVYAERDGEGRRSYQLFFEDGSYVFARRVVMTTGLGTKSNFAIPEGDERIMGFREFMASMDSTFPLRGMERVAVIGGGDSAKVAVEALVGQSPGQHMSVASLDYPKQIDWYGIASIEGGTITEASWCETERSRYRALGRFFRNEPGGPRIRGLGLANRVTTGYDVVMVDGKPYSHVVVCTGTALDRPTVGSSYLDPFEDSYTMPLGLRANYDGPENIYVLGPAAGLPVTEEERRSSPALGNISENSAAIFRYSQRTAQFAAAVDNLDNPTP